MINSRDNVMTNAVRAFYFCGDNKKYDEAGNEITGEHYKDEFTTRVLSHNIRVNADVINRLIGITYEGGETRIPPNFDYVEACRIINGDNRIKEVVSDVAGLDAHTRILHLIVCQCLNVRKGNYTKVTKEDMYIMTRIIQGNPPNLGMIIVKKNGEGSKMVQEPSQ